MDTREEKQLQLARCGQQTHRASVPQVVVRHPLDIRQRRYVEHQIRELGEKILGTANVRQCSFP